MDETVSYHEDYVVMIIDVYVRENSNRDNVLIYQIYPTKWFNMTILTFIQPNIFTMYNFKKFK